MTKLHIYYHLILRHCILLKEYVIIIDTPGVGESDEMTTKVLEYLPEALAFIYVINTSNAGGVQEDRVIMFISICYFLLYLHDEVVRTIF